MAISIVIPSTGKRTDILYATVEAALEAVKNLEAEIILIVNPEKPVPFSDAKLHVVHVDFNNVSASRNLGAKKARFDTVLFIDDDILINEQSLLRVNSVLASLKHPFLMNLVWTHTDKVQELKQKTALGKLMTQALPNDSFYKRYTNIYQMADWQDDVLFESSLRQEFSEACFVMNKDFFLSIGGFDEKFYFGKEGYNFLSKLAHYDWHYYIDAKNHVGHNEWDKYSDWTVLETRVASDAALVNDQIDVDGPKRATYKSVYYKLMYGTLLYNVLPLAKTIIEQLPAESAESSIVSNLYTRYNWSVFWHTISWKTVLGKGK